MKNIKECGGSVQAPLSLLPHIINKQMDCSLIFMDCIVHIRHTENGVEITREIPNWSYIIVLRTWIWSIYILIIEAIGGIPLWFKKK